ncbi:MAG: tRNA uridine-5-carboxymethylaminomethyl(34) synthesis GTPase MnmE [Sphingopyxis sp.]|nr:tRNA uridine-5-carboxymethylaminomethyl(34) synthesis GTPase MnmE [Sphingopyxis sp.]
MSEETIFALSSGAPPAGVAVVRVSGPAAGAALTTLAGKLPPPRRAVLRSLRDPDSAALLDRALVLWLPGPGSATGEDMAELHLHGGRAVVAAVLGALGQIDGLRAAAPGEFTRRAMDHGRIDLAEAEGLADLLAAETESQRRQAIHAASGHVSAQVAAWQAQLLALSAQVEAALDFADEGDVAAEAAALAQVAQASRALHAELATWLARPAAERIRDGLAVVIAGPPNAGKSTLINALAQREAAIVSPLAGTTRDVIEVPLALDGIAMRFADTAGLRNATRDSIEAIGIDRAAAAVAAADILLWLGAAQDCPNHPHAITLSPQSDRHPVDRAADLAISAQSGAGMAELHGAIVAMARGLIPAEGEAALHARQRAALREAADWLNLQSDSSEATDAVLLGERLRLARAALDRITGRAGVEDVLDALFGRFCIGK